MKKSSFFILLVICFVCGFIASMVYGGAQLTQISKTNNYEFYFINKSVLSSLGKHYIINFSPLRNNLEKISSKYPQKTYLYFVYLNSASSIGIKEEDDFSAASLVKVPLAIAIYKAVEEKRISLDQSYTLEESDLNSRFGDLYKTGKGETFTVVGLIKIMLEKSDNTAHDALVNVFLKIGVDKPYDQVYEEFGWDVDVDKEVDANKINLKILSNMFLSLYNSTYLSITDSNAILADLSNTPFNNKIVAGVPSGIIVSHKIGLFPDKNVYSDCGIVYAPGRNYLLCLGSEGANEEKANAFMKEVSGVVYDYVIKN